MITDKTKAGPPPPHRYTHREDTSRLGRYPTVMPSQHPEGPPTPDCPFPTEEPRVYTAITTEILARHDTYQSSIHQDNTAQRNTQQQNATHLHTVQALGVRLPPRIWGRLGKGQTQVAMTSQQHSDLSIQGLHNACNIQQPTVRHTQDRASSGNVECVSEAGYPHGQTNVQNPVYWIPHDNPQPFYTAPLGQDIADWGYDLVGVGTQFDTDDNSKDAYIPHVNGPAHAQG
ncbi:uncharacterized protein BP5553_09874 [Venustampulla echinocandica]|uniref:Uncharacterized protein n=1 Tax=Venustampulla echinocandica TaxID=2656787 RepID=A0A370TAX6_9HELO|nr:uncharacterized protein BP5553_09874 [Venustampulla echinocandica]RDL31085.1 hypothetical protein BP5553_09874 [Venustampulla echinocandica]